MCFNDVLSQVVTALECWGNTKRQQLAVCQRLDADDDGMLEIVEMWCHSKMSASNLAFQTKVMLAVGRNNQTRSLCICKFKKRLKIKRML